MEELYIVYVRTDNDNRIISVNSSAFLNDPTDWIKIDEGYGDRYYHAQGNYFPYPILTEDGVFRYKLVDGSVVERTPEEMGADFTPVIYPNTPPEERIAALEAELAATKILLGVE